MHTTETIPSGAALIADQPSTTGPIVVATDGSESSEPALQTALRLTQHAGGRVYAVAIHELMPLPVVEFAVTPALLEAEAGRREVLRRQVASQVHRLAGEENRAWSIVIHDGEPATELARISDELGARALVIGVKHRQLADRLFGRETALRLLHLCRVPLLIVPAGFVHAPRRVLIAIDFSAASLDAARVALRLFDSISEVLLLHVTPTPVSAPQMYATWREWLDEDTTGAFLRAKSELGLPPHITVQSLTREGHAAREIVSVARDKDVDLIVTGTRGAGLLDRLLIGSTARSVVHGAECAVLVVRPPDPSHRAGQ